jgi:glutathione S-transferase
MKLYVFPPTSNNRKVLAVARHLGLEPEIEEVDLFAGAQMRPEFRALNPNQKVPTLVDGDLVLWESNAIMQYLASQVPGQTLWPRAPAAQADVSRWQCWQLAHWDGQACAPLTYERVVKPLARLGPPDPAAIGRAEEFFHRFAAVLEAHLADRRWLVGDDVTLADFAVGAPLIHAEDAAFPLAGYDRIGRWFDDLAALDGWRRSAPPARPGAPATNGGGDRAVPAAHL